MPKRDGTGPMGSGAMTGRGLGYCNTNTTVDKNSIQFGRGQDAVAGFGRGQGTGFGRGQGLGRGQGFGIRCGRGYFCPRTDFANRNEETEKQLRDEKQNLQYRIDEINKQLNN